MRLFALLFIFLIPFQSQGIVIDGIAAVVGKDVVLMSELDEIVRLSMMREGQVSKDSSLFNERRRLVLDKIIDDKVLLARAKKESVQVSLEEVNTFLDNQLSSLSKQFGSMEAFEANIKEQYGLTLAKLKKQYRKDIRDNILKQKFRERLFYKTSVTREDVISFYETYKDSLPREKSSINLSHILMMPTHSVDIEKKAREKIEAIKLRLDAGESFEKLAFELSEGPSAKDSGDIGIFRKGGLGLPAFEKEVFSINAGEISKIVRSKLGFHIIKVVKRNDREASVKHILTIVKPSQNVEKAIRSTLDSIRENTKDSVSFALAAQKFSMDENTNKKGGYLGWYTKERLFPEYFNAIKDLDQGEISEPVKIKGGYHIFRVNRLEDSRMLTISDDYNMIEKLAKSAKSQEKLDKNLRKWREDVYIKNYLSGLLQ